MSKQKLKTIIISSFNNSDKKNLSILTLTYIFDKSVVNIIMIDVVIIVQLEN